MVTTEDDWSRPPRGGWKKDWASSDAKKILASYIKTGVVTQSTMPAQARSLHPSFRYYNPDNFRSNYRELQKKIGKDYTRSSFDATAVAHDKQLHPTQKNDSKNDSNGRLRWNGSAAVKEIFAKAPYNEYLDGKKILPTTARVALYEEHPAA